jgi:hypothetical protein
MDLVRLAPASEVTGRHTLPFYTNLSPPATSEAGARRPRSISNYGVLCQTLKTRTLKIMSTTKSLSSAIMGENVGPLPNGKFSRLRENWSVFEDGALAERLQSEEINTHLSRNQQRNEQIRQDLPYALEEQSREDKTAGSKVIHGHKVKQLK